MTKLEKPGSTQILSADPSLTGFARSDLNGRVLEAAGDLDAEAACAAVTMAWRPIAEATSEVGLGRPLGWHASLGDASWYVVPCVDQLVVVLGASTRNASATLKNIAASCGARS